MEPAGPALQVAVDDTHDCFVFHVCVSYAESRDIEVHYSHKFGSTVGPAILQSGGSPAPPMHGLGFSAS